MGLQVTFHWPSFQVDVSASAGSFQRLSHISKSQGAVSSNYLDHI